ncbi:phosphodiester glycosidase family protein [Rubritalea spongiae]|uniref:Phosphodiester glycosidase family protein n=1 Tax=Rubritalea spongiae TaxID=430797 RepID=A0ABW5DZT6_9BACT
MTSFLPIVLLASSLSINAQEAPRAIIVDESSAMTHASYHHLTSEGVSLHLVKFNSRHYQLEVIDQANGPGSQWPDSASVGKSHKALAVINGGFFTPEGAPLGKLIASGTDRGSNNPSSLGSGFYFANAAHAGIARRASLEQVIKQAKPTQLLQTGPMLSYRGEPVAGLSNEQSRARSFLATDGSNLWLIGYTESATLAQLGQALSSKSLAEVHIYNAINLDGGRSSDLWVSPSVNNGNKTFRAFWNKPVLNFLALQKK